MSCSYEVRKDRDIPAKLWCGVLFLGLSAFVLAQSAPAPTPGTLAPPVEAAQAAHRLKISEVSTSELLVERVPPKYPETSLHAGIQGTVVLTVDIDTSGSVQNVTVVSGDAVLSQAATDAVWQWKYKPYLLDGTPVEIETQVSIDFHISNTPPSPPDLGIFSDDMYRNEYFGLYYPLSHDWVRETQLVRKHFSEKNHSGDAYVLLTEVHIPQDNIEPRADSTFTVFAARRSSKLATDSCNQYLDALAAQIQAAKQGKLKGKVSQFTFATHDFYREDFEFKNGVSNHSMLCTSEKDYLLLWNVEGWTWKAVDGAVSTLNSLAAVPPAPASQPAPRPASVASPKVAPSMVKTPLGVAAGLLIKKVQPTYPEEARRNRVQGSIRMAAVINKTGDVVDLELIDGPIELAVSAVNAVRLWKYRPYLFNGEPVAVDTQVIVNYTLGP
jgi:TonB family protein